MLDFIQTVQKETSHRLNNVSSLIDNSWINDMNKFLQMSNYETVSKHDLIVTMVKLKGIKVNKKVNFARSLKDFNQDYLKLDLLAQQWTKIYNLKDPNLIAGTINKFFIQILDLHAPRALKVVLERRKEMKLSKECLGLMKERDKLKQRAKKTKSSSDWKNWRKIRNKVNNMVRNKKKKQTKTEFN